MVEFSSGNSSINNHTLFKLDFDTNNGYVSSGNFVINSHKISQCNDSVNFKEMDGDVENDDVSSRYGTTNRHTTYQNNSLKSFMNYNDRDDMKTNYRFHNVYVSSEIGLINIHTLPNVK